MPFPGLASDSIVLLNTKCRKVRDYLFSTPNVNIKMHKKSEEEMDSVSSSDYKTDKNPSDEIDNVSNPTELVNYYYIDFYLYKNR
jgi:hypothetical protein